MAADSATRTLLRRCDALAACSEEPGRLTRRFATPAMDRAHELLAGWMRAAGMRVRRDNIGNLIGRYEADRPGARAVLLGSHLDTVRDAGRYDGPLGVLAGLAVVERLHARGRRLPFAVEVAAFADEEGLRYHVAYLGSSAVAGTFDPSWLDLVDVDDIPMAQAIREFGGDPAALAGDRRPDDVLCYCEAHIEQGPVLEELGLPVGVVGAIAGQSRIEATFEGRAGHAGTVPMSLRRDALCAAAELALAVETLGRATDGLVATVGRLAVEPGASNVIPGRATLSIDVRHRDDATLADAVERLRQQAERIGARRGVAPSWCPQQRSPATPCDERLSALLAQAIEEQGYRAEHLTSGAGHDAVAMAALAPVCMLFVRCAGGVSHHPDEAVAEPDIAVAVDVLERYLELLAGGPHPPA